MKPKIFCLPKHGADLELIRRMYGNAAGPPLIVDTTSGSAEDWQRDLSPFYLGPCRLYGRYTARRMENAWQYSKVYWEHAGKDGPKLSYWEWAKAGWDSPRATRYPMGRGRKPEYSWWGGLKLDYVGARKVIYGPLYAETVRKTAGWSRLESMARGPENIVLLDYDAYGHRGLGMNLTQVLNEPRRKMGHAFVLAMLLRRDHALKQMELR